MGNCESQVVKKGDGTILHLWFYCSVDVDKYKFSSNDLYVNSVNIKFVRNATGNMQITHLVVLQTMSGCIVACCLF
jgi:hypothetical protein